MSAGHRHHSRHTPELISEVKRLLALPEIKAYLAKPFKTDISQKIPLTGGSSVDGKTYFLDPDIPKNLRQFVLWHERTEKAFRAVLKMDYGKAHNLATCAEHILVDSKDVNWTAYKSTIGKIVRENEKEAPHKMPVGFDVGPYRESGEMKLLSRAT
jgi:hypothetical protein